MDNGVQDSFWRTVLRESFEGLHGLSQSIGPKGRQEFLGSIRVIHIKNSCEVAGVSD